MSIADGDEHVIYKGEAIDGQLIDHETWNNSYNCVNYKHDRVNCTLKVFLWNTGSEEAFVDEFSVSVTTSDFK